MSRIARTRSATGAEEEGCKKKCSHCKWNLHEYSKSELAQHVAKEHPSCLSCGTFLNKYHRGMQCSNHHSLCKTECTPNFISSQLSENLTSFKCSICSVLIPIAYVKNHMSLSQKSIFESLVAQASSRRSDFFSLQCYNIRCGHVNEHSTDLLTTDVMMPCKFCSFFTCSVCCTAFDTTRFTKAASLEYEQHRARCNEIIRIKREFEEAVVKGTSFQCPRCQRGGRKDDGCNYIHCAGCPAVWCYLCGLEETTPYHQCAPPPVQVSVSPTFVGSALDRLHHARTVQLLHVLYLKYGEAKFRVLWTQFESVRAHGYTLEEIAQTKDL